jgi:CDP-glucose 4,6-dehydratase
MSVDSKFWNGKRVFVTGHTGFKGGWLSLWLQRMRADVHGIALAPPTSTNLFTEAAVGAGMTSTIGDIRDYEAVRVAMKTCQPEIVFHLAAQPLVRMSYSEPVATYATNVMGTVHVLEAVREVGSVRSVVNVTTDKCYENKEWAWGYREDDALGGYDPYSNSKACSELVTSAYRRSFFQASSVWVASARAGNVIGGGDWAADRLVPDILRALEARVPVVIRNPDAVRPWQHVLEPLSGYLALAERLCGDSASRYSEAWNFGPREDDARPVQWIVEQLTKSWDRGATWDVDGGPHLHEAHYLKLDISKARAGLNWAPRWSLQKALQMVTAWHSAWLGHEDMNRVCQNQIAEYVRSSETGSTSP